MKKIGTRRGTQSVKERPKAAGMRTLVGGAIVTVLVLAVGCGGSAQGPAETAGHAGGRACLKLAQLCHGQDAKSELARDCHLFGHAKRSTEKQCSERLAQCEHECRHANRPAASTFSGEQTGASELTSRKSRVHDLPRGCYVMKHRAREQYTCFGCVYDTCIDEDTREWDYVDQAEVRLIGHVCTATPQGCRMRDALSGSQSKPPS